MTEKYGEDSKLIYRLNVQQNEEPIALRYDLTVPLARYVVSNKISAFKRFQIGKVYRLDEPKINRGRFREFYQCDFDIVGQFGTMIPDVECLHIVYEVLEKLNLGSFIIYVSLFSLGSTIDSAETRSRERDRVDDKILEYMIYFSIESILRIRHRDYLTASRPSIVLLTFPRTDRLKS